MMTDKLSRVMEDSSMVEENEIKANWFSAIALTIAVGMVGIAWLLNVTGVFISGARMVTILFFSLIPFMMAPMILIKGFKCKGKWLKYFIMTCAVVVTSYLLAFLTYNVPMVMVFPVLLSCHYYSSRLSVYTAAFTIIGTGIAMALGVYIGSTDMNMVQLFPGTELLVETRLKTAVLATGAIDYPGMLGNTMRYGFFPYLLCFAAMAAICAMVSKRTHRLLQSEKEATQEKERIGTELSVATHIQESMLPKILPDFPGRPEFDIYASMHPAKEVGGDFYDCFFVDEDHFAFIIADVSGKGVPAALFMVISKTLLKNHLQAGLPPDEAFTATNNQLCADNGANMFVTCWGGVYEISTGKLTYVNAGHNPPLLSRGKNGFEYLTDKPNLVFGIMDDIPFRQQEVFLSPGDRMYLYTDGVTEATDTKEQLYGNDRLQAVLNAGGKANAREMCERVKADVDKFVGEAPQFDDITMLFIVMK